MTLVACPFSFYDPLHWLLVRNISIGVAPSRCFRTEKKKSSIGLSHDMVEKAERMGVSSITHGCL